MNAEDARAGTRVFKKTSPNGQITTYLGKRDFIDHQSHVDVIDGMILLEPECLNKRVYATLLAAFRYGREDMDVLGLQFRKDLVSLHTCVYPPSVDDDPTATANGNAHGHNAGTYRRRPLTRLQERLKKKLGDNAFPFWFEVPPNSASSVTLQPAPGDTGKPCGVDYELCTFVGDRPDERPKKQSTVRLAIRKLTYAPHDALKTPQPSAEISKEFLMSTGLLHLEATLDKGMYYHGESISVNVNVQNNSNKTVKKVKTSVVQVADICLFTTATYTCEVARLESADGCPVEPGSTLSKVYTLCPLLANNKDKRGLALDGKLKHEDTNLASSTVISDTMLAENLGIVVQYKVKIRLSLAGAFGGELTLDLPFTLSHPKPLPSPLISRHVSPSLNQSDAINAAAAASAAAAALDVDLIQLETDGAGQDAVKVAATDDDIIFEDFARLRLKACDSVDHDL